MIRILDFVAAQDVVDVDDENGYVDEDDGFDDYMTEGIDASAGREDNDGIDDHVADDAPMPVPDLKQQVDASTSFSDLKQRTTDTQQFVGDSTIPFSGLTQQVVDITLPSHLKQQLADGATFPSAVLKQEQGLLGPHVVDTNELGGLDSKWVTSIRERHQLQPTRLTSSSSSINCTIHRVPYCLRRHNENAFDPQIISIGPFHYERRKDKLQSMEEHKWRYLHDIVGRKGENHLQRCLVAVNKLEERARRRYSEKVELDCNPFVEMMVLDGLFIIELFRRALKGDYDADPILKLGWLRGAITMDLLMLENQIPFFVLKCLCSVMGFYKDSDQDSLMNSVLSFFGLQRQGATKINRSFRHLLHLVHWFHLPSFPDGKLSKLMVAEIGKKPAKRMSNMIPNASRLQDAGIKFKKGEAFSNIKFNKGVIEIPPLKVEDTTNSTFLNLAAFEQCFRYCKSHFSRFIYFMDCLIDNAKDVKILCENGIIDRWLSSDKEVAALVNKMGREVMVYDHDGDFQKFFEEINQYYGASWHEWRASLMRNYFSNPWAIISVVAAIVLLVFTITQTFFAAFPKFANGN